MRRRQARREIRPLTRAGWRYYLDFFPNVGQDSNDNLIEWLVKIREFERSCEELSAKVFGIDEGAENEDTNDVTWGGALGDGYQGTTPEAVPYTGHRPIPCANPAAAKAVVVAVLSFPTARSPLSLR